MLTVDIFFVFRAFLERRSYVTSFTTVNSLLSIQTISHHGTSSREAFTLCNYFKEKTNRFLEQIPGSSSIYLPPGKSVYA
jgi:hypothetical protein